ncbi:VOC family protein [Chitinibacter tainanensis]|uniref:VOC family protein n=1 Tax=Chitinibacter tainanensis TaxID=230667 RepID=UPI000424ACAA|nr:VOC family protein [Chitinibacter tainanensis]
MRPRLNLILLGVNDLARASAFYAALGWPQAPTSHAGFVKIDLGGVVLGLLDRAELAKDCLAPVQSHSGFAGFALVYIAHSAAEVSTVLAAAAACGAEIVKPATTTAWGVAGYFRDLDGHLFEVCYEAGWVFDADDHLVV